MEDLKSQKKAHKFFSTSNSDIIIMSAYKFLFHTSHILNNLMDLVVLALPVT